MEPFLAVTANFGKDWEIGDTAISYLEKRKRAGFFLHRDYFYTVYSNKALNKLFLIGIKARGK